MKICIWLLPILVVFIGGCSSPSSGSAECSQRADCAEFEECRFAGKRAVSGVCQAKTDCDDTSGCLYERACGLDSRGQQVCGGTTEEFTFVGSDELPIVHEHDSFQHQIELIGTGGSYHFELEEGSHLPDGLALDAQTGLIHGRPQSYGQYGFGLRAYNGAQDADYYYDDFRIEQDFYLMVLPDEDGPCQPNPCNQGEKIRCLETSSAHSCVCDFGYLEDAQGDCVLDTDDVLTIMAANISSGGNQSYRGPGIRIFLGLQPDIVLIQEFNYETENEFSFISLEDFVAQVFGPGYGYYRGSGNIPNGIISRYRIIEAGGWDDVHTAPSEREFEWARIDIPGPRDLWAVSVHFRTTSASMRKSEAENLVAYIQSNVPEDDYLVIGGDLNTTHRGEACMLKLMQVVDTSSPYPVDQDGVDETNAPRSKPYDWVLADDELQALSIPLQVGSQSFSNGLVFDSRVYQPLDEVAPIESQDSAAFNMQHMAVMRAFRLD
jgi:endonuclease/exonuclease/phosphatase family metal-dependent hydrolase